MKKYIIPIINTFGIGVAVYFAIKDWFRDDSKFMLIAIFIMLMLLVVNEKEEEK